MIQTAYLITFVIGAFMGALLMALTALVRSEQWRRRDQRNARREREKTKDAWHVVWANAADRADHFEALALERKAKLDAIHLNHVRAGKAAHSKHRAAVLAKAAEMRAQMGNNTVFELDKAA